MSRTGHRRIGRSDSTMRRPHARRERPTTHTSPFPLQCTFDVERQLDVVIGRPLRCEPHRTARRVHGERIAGRLERAGHLIDTAGWPDASRKIANSSVLASTRTRRSGRPDWRGRWCRHSRLRTSAISIYTILLARSASISRAGELQVIGAGWLVVCCPSVGGAVRTDAGVSDSLIGVPSTCTGPSVACITCSTMWRAAICGSANSSARSRTEPHGTPACVSASIHWDACSRAEAFGQQSAAARRSGDALPVGGKPFAEIELRDRAESPPQVVVADSQHEVAV